MKTYSPSRLPQVVLQTARNVGRNEIDMVITGRGDHDCIGYGERHPSTRNRACRLTGELPERRRRLTAGSNALGAVHQMCLMPSHALRSCCPPALPEAVDGRGQAQLRMPDPGWDRISSLAVLLPMPLRRASCCAGARYCRFGVAGGQLRKKCALPKFANSARRAVRTITPRSRQP
jgi:hypothetical protein